MRRFQNLRGRVALAGLALRRTLSASWLRHKCTRSRVVGKVPRVGERSLRANGLAGPTPPRKLHRDLGISYPTAWYLLHRIREALVDVAVIFGGPVEGDES